MTRPTRPENPGVAVDAEGRAVVDPTDNVLALVAAANKRQDDLRAADGRRIDESLNARFRHLDDLIAAGFRRLEDLANLRAAGDEKLRDAEAKRIDAIRAVDVNAVAVASQRAADQAQVLATQVSSSAETIRTALNQTATTIAAQMDSKFAGITERIAALEKSSYTGEGRSNIANPQIDILLAKVESLRESHASSGGERRGISTSAAIIMGVVSLIATLLGIGAAVLALRGG